MTSIASGAVLSAAMTSSLNALGGVQSQIDRTQLRMATGLRVNSPLDDAQNYFDASALTQRAAGLNSLLDGISRSISTISAASEALSSLNDMVAQAQSVANEALELVADGEAEAVITGDQDLSDVTDLVAGVSGVNNNDKLLFSFVDFNGSISSGNTVTIASGDSIDDLISGINSIVDGAANAVFEADLADNGGLRIRERNGNRFEIEFQDAGGASDTTLASALGFGDLTINERTNGTADTRTTVAAEPSLTSVRLYDENGGANAPTATASTLLRDLTNLTTGLAGDIFNGGANDRVQVAVNGDTAQTVVSSITTGTVQTLVDGINNNATLSSKIEASFDADSGKLNIRALDSDVRSIQFDIVEALSAAGVNTKMDLQKLGFGMQVLTATNNTGNTASESIELGSAAGTLASLENSYDSLLDQIDSLVEDAVYSGTNLLEGDDLTTFFNEDRSTFLSTLGQSFTYDSLGIGAANFGRSETISQSVDETESALDAIEQYSSSISNDLSIIETREDFTNNLITTLEEGAGALTLADQTEEGARMIALQTRQLLGVSALALASASQQSTLRLF